MDFWLFLGCWVLLAFPALYELYEFSWQDFSQFCGKFSLSLYGLNQSGCGLLLPRSVQLEGSFS